MYVNLDEMGKFLERHQSLKLTHEKNLKGLISN